jgi:hypothetical protein
MSTTDIEPLPVAGAVVPVLGALVGADVAAMGLPTGPGEAIWRGPAALTRR